MFSLTPLRQFIKLGDLKTNIGNPILRYIFFCLVVFISVRSGALAANKKH